jgi:hypothetical protein
MSNLNKKRCIVLLPAAPHFERLFDESVEPAITQMGLVPFRPQWSNSAPTPINIFVDEIEQAAGLIADISRVAPEMWLAVGCAAALGTPLCLVSSLQNPPAPLGIQHLPLIPYPANALREDYVQLRRKITAQLSPGAPETAISQPKPPLQTPSRQPPAVTKYADDLVSYEILALTIIDRHASDTGLSPRDLSIAMQDSECSHLTSHAMSGLRRRRFIERRPVQIVEKNEVHTSENLFVTRTGKDWLARHSRRATARRTAAHSRAQFVNER